MIKRIKLTKNLSLKEVSLRDVRYVYKLRSDKHLTKYINPRKNDTINKQRVWLKEYLIRRKNHDEFYFIFQIKNKNIYKNLGFARIIRLNQNTFHFGGWILEKNSKPWVALESCLSIYEYAFKKLDLDYNDYVTIDPKYFRPEELKNLKGDSTKLRTTLGWTPEYTFESMLEEMVHYEYMFPEVPYDAVR